MAALRAGIQGIGGAADRCRVVVAEHDYRAVGCVPFDKIQHRNRIGAVADQITKKRKPVRAQCLRVTEARREGLQVAMNIGEQSEFHRRRSESKECAMLNWLRNFPMV
jgi:hypothetical protein